MSHGRRDRKFLPGQNSTARQQIVVQTVDSLLDAMRDGNEYGSIVGLMLKPATDLTDEVVRGLRDIEAIRGRPCLCYVGNVIGAGRSELSGVDATDDLPFGEMVQQLPQSETEVDVFLATNGGSGHQITRFVNNLRPRFEKVNFLIPSFCMSAGTLFALSGDRIWMGARACLGPIDPQVPTKDGRFVPAQALLLLVEQLQTQGDAAMKKGGSVPWTAVRIIDSLDKKELGDAITATNYSTMMAAQFLKQYKFKDWAIRETSQQVVTDSFREQRANDIAQALASHDRWKSHGHAISREVLWNEIKLKIDHPDASTERAMNRLWAVLYWIFDKTPVVKFIVSNNYRYVRQGPQQVPGG
jgi:hypothetical protein